MTENFLSEFCEAIDNFDHVSNIESLDKAHEYMCLFLESIVKVDKTHQKAHTYIFGDYPFEE